MYTHMFPVWFDLFNVYIHSPFTTIIILDSLLEDLNGTTILTKKRNKEDKDDTYGFNEVLHFMYHDIYL